MQPNKWEGEQIFIETSYDNKASPQQTELSEAPSLLLVLRVYKVCGCESQLNHSQEARLNLAHCGLERVERMEEHGDKDDRHK